MPKRRCAPLECFQEKRAPLFRRQIRQIKTRGSGFKPTKTAKTLTRAIAIALCLASLGGTAAGQTVNAGDPDAWATFRGDSARTGARGEGPARLPDLLWRFPTDGTVESSPAVVGGVLFEGTFANALFALDAQTGEELWPDREGLSRRRLRRAP